MTIRSPSTKTDPRTARSRAALIGAFNRLLLAEGYDALDAGTIAATAGVARSTFYVHFAGKAALFRHVLQPILQPLADTLDPQSGPARLDWVLAHFWDNRRHARVVMTGRPRILMESRLAELIEARLRRDRYTAIVPLPMAAIHIAHGQLAMIEVWLLGRHRCDVPTMARAITATASAAADALSEKVGHPVRNGVRVAGQRSHGAASSTAMP